MNLKNLWNKMVKYKVQILILFCLLLGLGSLIFKNSTLDDDLYLWETSMMTEALKNGEWFGNYAVGTHGFLFKLPVALIFLITGPSLAIATVWNVILACASLYLFYTFLQKIFRNETYAFLGTFLLFSNFQFILNLPTYMREIPVLLSLILFLYTVVTKKNLWFVGLSLLLVFDAKEYVLLMIVPGYILYLLFTEWKGFNIQTFLNYIKGYTQVFLPTLIFIVLMITTPLIPLNMYALSLIPEVTKGGIEYNIKHFDTEKATTNKIDDNAPTLQDEFEGNKVLDTIVSYVGKILYPRSFSFLSLPKIIFFPAILTSFFLFKNAWKKKDNVIILLSLVLWSFISIFILRASFDRYLFPILPVVFYFFLLFIKEIIKEKKKYLFIVSITTIFAILGLLFEVDYVWIKVILNFIIISLFVLYFFYNQKFKNLHIWLIAILGTMTFSVVSFFFYANGQLHQYLLWGHDYEVKEVVSLFDNNQRIMMNDVGWDILVKVYRGDNMYNPEWKWELNEWVPRKGNLKMFSKMDSFNISGKTLEQSKNIAMENRVEKVVLAVSTIEQYPFFYQEKLDQYLNADWLVLEKTVNMKNKMIYIFDVKN